MLKFVNLIDLRQITMQFKSLFIALFCFIGVHAQEGKRNSAYAIGFSYGNGSEFKNTDYTYTNRYIQAQVYYTFNPLKKWQYQMALQPEVNFARHRLKNFYFVKAQDPDFEDKREAYMKLMDIKEYILNVALFVRYKCTNDLSIYIMGNVGPMITDTETGRLTKGFAFCDVFGMGTSYNLGDVAIDVRVCARHVSNAGLQSENAGFNTKNIAFGIIVPLECF